VGESLGTLWGSRSLIQPSTARIREEGKMSETLEEFVRRRREGEGALDGSGTV